MFVTTLDISVRSGLDACVRLGTDICVGVHYVNLCRRIATVCTKDIEVEPLCMPFAHALKFVTLSKRIGDMT
jgi:hypothetical protein